MGILICLVLSTALELRLGRSLQQNSPNTTASVITEEVVTLLKLVT
ncbi:hypothetical protein [Fischerella thermalis]|nr:hypothetical protein [Fischerella thermalis]